MVAELIEAFDRAASPFRADSELALANRVAPEPARVSPLLLEALQAALRGARISGGTVDPTLGLAPAGPAAFPAGDRRGGPVEPTGLAAHGRWRELELDLDNGTVRVPRGCQLDLGATAKALLVDRAAAVAAQSCGGAVLVAIGGDVAVRGGDPPWPVLVGDNHRRAAGPLQLVAVGGGGLATSSTTTRRRWWQGRSHSHIIDPRAGVAVEGPWRTVSVAAATCLDANIAATAAIVLGEEAVALLRGWGLPARLVGHDGATVTVGGWPEERLCC